MPCHWIISICGVKKYWILKKLLGFMISARYTEKVGNDFFQLSFGLVKWLSIMNAGCCSGKWCLELHITVEDKISPPGECGIGTLTLNRKGGRMDMWLVVGMQRNSLGIPWVKEYLWIVSQGCNTVGYTWSATERLCHAEISLSFYFQIVSTMFWTFHFYSAPLSMLIFS